MSADNYIAVREQDGRYYVTMEFASNDTMDPINPEKDKSFGNYQDAVDHAIAWEASEYVEYGVSVLCNNPDKSEKFVPDWREGDIEFEVMLNEKVNDLESEILRHHKDFESISALCTIWRNGHMSAEDVVHKIQNIVG